MALWSFCPKDPNTLGTLSHKTFIDPCYYVILDMIVKEPTKLKRKLITVKYYLTKEESAQIQKIAYLIYNYKAIPRPTIGAFAKASVLQIV